MCWDAIQQFPDDTRSPAAARHFCTDQLTTILADQPGRGALLDDVALIASELMTNSVNAGSSATTIGLSWHRHVLRLTVSDDAPGLPALQYPTPDQSSGRGLAIIQALATSWGVEDVPTGRSGKRVWAEMRIAALLTENLPCSR